jgi:hypothetical protein
VRMADTIVGNQTVQYGLTAIPLPYPIRKLNEPTGFGRFRHDVTPFAVFSVAVTCLKGNPLSFLYWIGHEGIG